MMMMMMTSLTLDNDVFSRRVYIPYDDGCVEGAGRDAFGVRAPGDAVHARCVEAPLLIVGKLGKKR